MLEYSKEVEKLPDFNIFSDKYDEIVAELQPKYITKVKEGISQEVALIKLGEETWNRLYDIYSIKPTFERR